MKCFLSLLQWNGTEQPFRFNNIATEQMEMEFFCGLLYTIYMCTRATCTYMYVHVCTFCTCTCRLSTYWQVVMMVHLEAVLLSVELRCPD